MIKLWKRPRSPIFPQTALVLSLCVLSASPLAQEGIVVGPPAASIVLPLKIVSAEIISFPEPRPIVFSGKVVRASEALLMKTAVAGRSLNRFPPSLNPMLYLGHHRYPILKQQSSNWDKKAERPLEPGRPVGEIEFLYFLIPNWNELEDGETALLAVRDFRMHPSPGGLVSGQIESLPVLEKLPGRTAFTRSSVVDSR